MLRAGIMSLCLGLAAPAWADDPAPARVVSINLCTDQLAMQLAQPGQLISVSRIARDPVSSAMAEEALAYPINSGRAEDVFLLSPDLVLAGQFTDPATVNLLRRLDIRVEQIPIARSLDDVRDVTRQMGVWLGREAQADAAIAALDATIAAIRQPETRPRMALHYANSYTSGAGSLPNAILTVAGFDNIGAELGLGGLSHLPLELLVTSKPDIVLQGQVYDPPARAQEIQQHPAVRAAALRREHLRDATWVCGTPLIQEAIIALAALRGPQE
jgi:iron complex transport system substrate-binding protein